MMTTFHQMLAQCPVCFNEETLTIWDSIDASSDPDLRERLLRKTLQSLECRNCGNSTLIAAPLTYGDPVHNLLIECRPGLDRGQLLDRLNELRQEHASEGPSDPDIADRMPFRRLTATMNDLIEKIHIREQQLDDRALEIVKLAVINHGAEESAVEDLHFVGVSANELNFMMKLADGWFQYALPLEAYNNARMILEQVGTHAKAADRGFSLVDRAYAEEMLATFTTAMSDPEGP